MVAKSVVPPHPTHIHRPGGLAAPALTHRTTRGGRWQVECHSEEVVITKSLLYDALVLGYLNTYNSAAGAFSVAAFDADLHRMAHVVMKLAIMVMADFIA
jgi:hypothetical protein